MMSPAARDPTAYILHRIGNNNHSRGPTLVDICIVIFKLMETFPSPHTVTNHKDSPVKRVWLSSSADEKAETKQPVPSPRSWEIKAESLNFVSPFSMQIQRDVFP